MVAAAALALGEVVGGRVTACVAAAVLAARVVAALDVAGADVACAVVLDGDVLTAPEVADAAWCCAEDAQPVSTSNATGKPATAIAAERIETDMKILVWNCREPPPT